MYIHVSPKLFSENILYIVFELTENKCYLIKSRMVANIYCGAAAAEKSLFACLCVDSHVCYLAHEEEL